MTLLSLFDGSGSFPLVASMCGITPVYASEVEPYPIAVTRSRFPNMIHLGDVSTICGAAIRPCSVVTFGSPCTDISIAGRREGIKHSDLGDEETTRSGLFMEAIRIVREMYNATNGKYPSFAVWENVPGAFNSNKGEDFRVVLEEFIKIVEPTAVMPPVPKGGWAYADMYCGDGWSLAYRILDAQHCGIPQRRRRVFLVLDLRGERAGKVLFERTRLCRDFEPIGAAWENNSHNSGNGVCTDGAESKTVERYLFENHSQDTRYNGPLNVCPTLPAQLGTGGNNTPFVVERNIHYYAMQGFGDYIESDVASSLKARDYKDATDLIVSGDDEYYVRRLTPRECIALQGLPKNWGEIDHKDSFTPQEYQFWVDVRDTYAIINGKPIKDYTEKQMLTWYNKLHTDSAEYKMAGNGVAIPCVLYIMQGIAEALKSE